MSEALKTWWTNLCLAVITLLGAAGWKVWTYYDDRHDDREQREKDDARRDKDNARRDEVNTMALATIEQWKTIATHWHDQAHDLRHDLMNAQARADALAIAREVPPLYWPPTPQLPDLEEIAKVRPTP